MVLFFVWLRRLASSVRILVLGLWTGPEYATESDRVVRPTKLGRRRYSAWVACYDRLTALDRMAIPDDIRHLPRAPLISILMPVASETLAYVREALESVEGQLYAHWELCIAGDLGSTDDMLAT